MIEVKNIVKTFNENTRKANTVLDHASITFPDHGFVFIVGKSGIGKSTILNAIGGLISYNGEILYDGKKEKIEQYRRKNIGYIFQDFLLFDDLSVRDNIKIGLNIAGVYDEKDITNRVNVLLKAVGLNINAKRSASALSLGQRQRVAIARALASNPKIILADEPTGNLDSKNSLNVMKILKKLSKDHLIICVTHNVNLVNLFADYAFAIKDKKFTQIDPKATSVDDTYVQNQINVATLSKKEIEDNNILFKIYSDDTESKSELTIIRRGGKILVIGDNVSLATKEDVSLINKIEEKKDTEDKVENSGIEYVDDIEDVDLNFENKAQKRTLKDTVLFTQIQDIFSLSNLKYKRKTKFFHKVAMLMPILIYIILNIGLGVTSLIADTLNANVKDYGDNTLVAVANSDDGFSLSSQQYFDLLNNPESHLIEGGNTLNVYTTGSNYLNSSPRRSNNSNYDYYEDNSVYTTSTNWVNKNYNNGIYKVTLADFSFLNSAKNKNSIKTTSYDVTFSNINNYTNLISSLKDISLEDDEIIVDKAIFNVSNYSLPTIEFEEGNLESNIKDTTLKLSYVQNSTSNKYLTLKIKECKDTGLATIYCNENTYRKIAMLNSLPNSNSYTYGMNLASLNYEYVNFSDLDESKYTFYKKTEDNGVETITNVSKADIEESYFDNLTTKIKEYTTSYLSDYSITFAAGYSSESVLNDSKLIMTLQEDENSDPVSFYQIGSYVTDTAIYVKDNTDANKKVVVLQDFSLDANKTTTSSIEEFLKNRVITSLAYNSTLNKSLTGSVVSIPKNYYDAISSSLDNLYKFYTNKFTFVANSDENDMTFTYSQGYLDNLLLSYYPKTSVTAINTLYYKQSREYLSFSNTYTYFLSDDVDASIKYINDRQDTYGFVFKKYTDVRSQVFNETYGSTLSPFIIAVVIMTVALVLIMIFQSIAKVNKQKYKFGVLRCLGKSIPDILFDYSANSILDFMFSCFIPTLIITLFLMAIQLFELGWVYAIYLICIFAIIILSDMIPLLISILRKPYQILKNLN